MKCPKCGRFVVAKDGSVLDSRPTTGGSIRRRRACLFPDCAHRWSTYEVDVARMDRIEQIERSLEEAARAAVRIFSLADQVGPKFSFYVEPDPADLEAAAYPEAVEVPC